MSPSSRDRRAVPSLLSALLACLAALGVSGPVRAECPYVVIPPATDAARSAREVIVGTVIENVGGRLYDFRLRIDHVLRGPAKVGDVRRVANLYPGWPFAETDRGPIVTDKGTPFAPCEPIPGWKGNVIALALDALAPDGATRYNAASWISGHLPVNQDLPRTTLAEIGALAALPQTDTTSPPIRTGTGSASPMAALLALAVALVVVAGLRARLSRSEEQGRVASQDGLG